MDCLNLSIPAFKQMAEDFGEFKTKFLLDSYFPSKIPTYDEFISDKDIKRALGIVSKSKISRLNNFNYSQNKNITYKLFNIKQLGQSDNFTWNLRKIEKPLDMEAKIERVQSRIVDAKQNETPVSKLKELQKQYPEVAQTMLNLENNCR